MRSRGILVCTTALVVAGCVAPLFEPLEGHIVEVRIPTTDGVTLHGWLKRPEEWLPGTPHPPVIMYGGVGQEVSEFVRRAHAGGHWGWLMINYRGFGLSGGAPGHRRGQYRGARPQPRCARCARRSAKSTSRTACRLAGW